MTRGAWARGLRALIEQTAENFVRHGTSIYAMALAYRGLFALLPFAAFLVAVLSFLRADDVLVWLAEQGPAGLRMPLPEMIGWLEDEVLGQTQGILLSGAIALAFWSVARGARVLTQALNTIFEVEETRPAWKRAAASVTVAPALTLAMIAALVLLLVTSRAVAWISSWVGLDAAFVFLWSLLRIPVALLLLSVIVSIAYRFAPSRRLTLRSVVPGALLAVVLWALASAAFAFGLAYFPDYGAAYGSLGAAISLVLYLYVSATAVLLGAEVNAAMLQSSASQGPTHPAQSEQTPKIARGGDPRRRAGL
jgi:membrane protein